MSLSLLCSEIAPPEHVEHSTGGIGSLLGAPQVSGRKPLKLLKPAATRRQLPISVDKKRLCHCLFILILLALVLYAIFAIVLPRLNNLNSALQIDAGHTNNSTMI